MSSIQEALHAEKTSKLLNQILDLNDELRVLTAERDAALLQLAKYEE